MRLFTSNRTSVSDRGNRDALIPANAVLLNDSDPEGKEQWAACRSFITVLAIVADIYLVAMLVGVAAIPDLTSMPALAGIVMAFSMGPVRKLIASLAVHGGVTRPMTRARYIAFCTAPSLVMGWLPLAVWAVAPLADDLGTYLFAFAAASAVNGALELKNAWNTMMQAPRNAMMQAAGARTYWYAADQSRDER